MTTENELKYVRCSNLTRRVANHRLGDDSKALEQLYQGELDRGRQRLAVFRLVDVLAPSKLVCNIKR